MGSVPVLKSDLSGSTIWSHASLTGPLVGAILEADHGLTSLQCVLVKISFILGRNLHTQSWTLPGLLLSHSTQRIEIVYYHVKVFVFIQIIDLKQILLLQSVVGASLQVHLDVFSLFKWSLQCVNLFYRSWLQAVNEATEDRPILEMLSEVNLILHISKFAACYFFYPCNACLRSLRAEFCLRLHSTLPRETVRWTMEGHDEASLCVTTVQRSCTD